MWIFLKFVLISLILRKSFANVKIDPDGGYTNIVVGIHPEVSKVESLFIELEDLFNSASKNLHESSKGNLFFKEVIFAVPKKYHDTTKFRNWESGDHYFRQPNVRITTNDVFLKAYTIQNDGCGKPGLRIHVPDEFVFKAGNTRGKDFIRAWVKYRYGVFDETGYVGDELYPACYNVPGTNITRVTVCTNKDGIYNIKQDEMEGSTKCSAVAKYGRNNGITSSLMSNMDFPNVKFFCDDDTHPHNKDVPSKQNNLCREQSVWKIISQHNDFKSIKRKSTTIENVKFKYIMESSQKLIFAVDTSREMDSDGRLDMIRNAFSYFMLYNLPENVTVGLTHLTSTEDRSMTLTVKTQVDAERLIDAFPEESDGGNNACVHCGIEKALRILKNYSDVPSGDIVIATTKDIEESRVKNLLSNNLVNLHIIYFNKRIKEPPILQKLISNGRGSFHYISENYKLGDSGSSLTQIYEVFRTVYESLSWMNKQHFLVNHRAFLVEDCSACNMTFSSDESLESFQVLLTGPNFLTASPIIKNSLRLSSQNESFSLGDSPFSYKPKIPAYLFKVEKPQPGMWSISFERRASSEKPIVVIVRGFTSNSENNVGMKTWINYNSGTNNIILKQPPITLYSEAKRGNFVINNATITAILHEVSTGNEITFPLFDNGDGDPDITKKDGIFSRYFLHAPNKGYYILSTKLEAEHYQIGSKENYQEEKPRYCCGSSYPSSAIYDPKPLIRVVTYGSVFMNEKDLDVSLPPRRINDLRVEKLVVLENGATGFHLKWTSPGDNYDYGTAQEYQMRVFKNKEDAQKNFGSAYIAKLNEWNYHGSMLYPQTPGKTESAIVELKNLTSGIYFLALRSVSTSGQKSDVSNVLELFYTESTITPTSIISTTYDTKRPIQDDSSDKTILALGISSGILFLLFLLGIFLLFYIRVRRQRKQQRDLDLNKQNAKSNDALCKDKDEQSASAISPVNSWPANSLINHYESQRCKKPDICNVPMVHKDSEDSISTVSSKYSYGVKYHVNPSFYESSYFPNPEREEINYPFNPTYDQFHPTYTSSLRRFPHNDVSSMFRPITQVHHSASLDGRPIQRLRTDV